MLVVSINLLPIAFGLANRQSYSYRIRQGITNFTICFSSFLYFYKLEPVLTVPITGYCAGAGLDPDWDDGRLDGHPGAPGRLQAPVDRRRGPGAHPQREHRRGHGQRERLPGLRE